MRMFNSRRINNDPEPYVVDFGLALGEVRGAEDCGSHWDSHDTRYEPRPEYDNNPNPILQEFRELVMARSASTTRESAAHLLSSFDAWFPLRGKGYTREHIDHARRVLERMVNVTALEYDYGDFAEPDSGAAIGVQWKGTDVCFDFYCECGKASHFDGYNAYAIQCGYCGKKFDMPYTVHLKEYTGTFNPVVTDGEGLR